MKAKLLAGLKDKYIYIFIIFLLSATTFIFFFKANLPVIMSYGKMAKYVDRKEKKLIVRKAAANQIYKLEQEIGRMEIDSMSFVKIFCLRPETSRVIKAITELSRELKISFVSLQPFSAQKREIIPEKKEAYFFFEKEGLSFFLWEMPIAIKMKIGYFSFLEFIERLETGEKFVKIDNFCIKKASSNFFIQDVNIKISMFSLPYFPKRESIKAYE